MSCNPIESLSSSATGPVVDRSNLSATIQQELIQQKLAGHSTVNDASLAGHRLPTASGCFKSGGADVTKAHPGSAKGAGSANEIAIPPSSSIYDKAKHSSFNKLHKANDANANEQTRPAGSSIHDSHKAVGVHKATSMKIKDSSLKNNDDFLEKYVKKDGAFYKEIEQWFAQEQLGAATNNSAKMDSSGAWEMKAPLAFGAAHATSDTDKESLKSSDGKPQASPIPNGDQFTIIGPAVRLGSANDCPPGPIQEYQAIGPAIPLGTGDPAPGFLNPFIATPGLDKKSN